LGLDNVIVFVRPKRRATVKTITKNETKNNTATLPVRQRIGFKLATLIDHQALSGLTPSYVADDCCFITNARPRRLRSADTRTLLVSRTCTNFGDRAFWAAELRVWNYLPTDLRQSDCL